MNEPVFQLWDYVSTAIFLAFVALMIVLRIVWRL